jgi:hypothetical protein
MGEYLTPAGWYDDPTNGQLLRWWDGTDWTDQTRRKSEVDSQNAGLELQTKIATLQKEYDFLKSQVAVLNDAMMLQEVGLFRYSHPLKDSPAFAQKIEEIECRIAVLLKSGAAVTGTKKWMINGSEKEGAKMVRDFGKLLLRAYNVEADSLVKNLKAHTLDAAVDRLEKLRAAVSKLGASMKLEVTEEFHSLRVSELKLTADFQSKLAEEKELERERKAKLREEEIAQREIDREKERIEKEIFKEQAHYQTVLTALSTADDATAENIKIAAHIVELQTALDGLTTRAANIRAGYVYVISNFGSFGERIVKIGLTRRLEPLDRVKELGDASVPFRFDVHALIFSNDAVSLETALHHRFADKRVNLVNNHREFFFVTPSEVREALIDLDANLLTFNEAPEALEWRQSATQRTARIGLNQVPR